VTVEKAEGVEKPEDAGYDENVEEQRYDERHVEHSERKAWMVVELLKETYESCFFQSSLYSLIEA
jgi:hypothetical protein